MRHLAVILSLVALLGCSTTAATSPAPEVTPVAAPLASTTSNRGAQMLAQAGRANAPTRADIERTFGAGDISRQDGAGVALTYRLNTCALLLVFTADAHNALRLMDAHASARQAGQAAPTLDQCGAEAEAHHP